MRAIEAASDALYVKPKLPQPPEETAREAVRRRADAMGLIAERAMAAGFGGGRAGEEETGSEAQAAESGAAASENGVSASESEHGAKAPPEPEPAIASNTESRAKACACEKPPPISGTKAERYQVVLHVDADTLSRDGEPGRSELEDGTRISCETSRRLACDASVVRVTHARDGSILNWEGRRARSRRRSGGR